MTKPRTCGFTFESTLTRNSVRGGRLRRWGRIAMVLAFCAATAIASPAQIFNTLLNFNGADGSVPDYGALIQGTDQNLYGTTSTGGANGAGSIFRLTPGGVLTTLYSFCSQTGCPDGANPYAGLVQGTDGNFYGTTYAGGANSSSKYCSTGCGTVFQLNSASGVLTPLYSFCKLANCSDGANPSGGLVQGANGSFYGTTYAGGNGSCGLGCGTIFTITSAGNLTTLAAPTKTQGAQLFAGLVLGSDGNFYGTAEGGGNFNAHGAVFVYNPVAATFTTLYSFCAQTNCPDGTHPYAGLIQALDGNFYGTTYLGGANNDGTVYEMSPPAQPGGAWSETVLYSFCAKTNCSDGSHPYAGVIQAADGNLYGTTSQGGANNDGEVFKLIFGKNSLYVLHSFAGADGESPYAGLVQANGNFYGTTTSGGANADGTVFGLNQTNVTTWQNDNLRTGQNANEIVLTPANLSTSNFGELCSVDLDGQVFAQPLVLADVTFNGTQYSSLVYVVTQMNTLYVINGIPPKGGFPCTVVTSLSLNPPGQYPAYCSYVGSQDCGTINPYVGALSTPVIQTAPNSLGTLFVVTETQDVPSGFPHNWFHYVHAVNLDQLVELTPPVRVVPPAFGCPACVPAQASFWSHHHIQRPGLLLANNLLYIAFSMMDGNVPLPNGAVFAYNAADLSAPPLYFATTTETNAGGGGIWQGGAGLAYGPDDNGKNYIYLKTGNGTWDGLSDWADSFIKLDPNSLTVENYFTPADQSYRGCEVPYTDLDFGSGGVMLTPANSYWPSMAVSGDKEGGVWAIDRLTPGGFNQCASGCSECSTTQEDQSDQNLQTIWLEGVTKTPTGPPIHNNPAYWNNLVFVAAQTVGTQEGYIYQFQICDNDQPGQQPFCSGTWTALATDSTGTPITTKYGATPAISAGPGASDAIVWLTSGGSEARSTHPGGLYALDANSMDQLYVNTGPESPCQDVDTIAPVTKFSVPTVANGYLYLGTQELQGGAPDVNNGTGTFYIFGLNRTCTGSVKTRHKSEQRAGANLSKAGIESPSLER